MYAVIFEIFYIENDFYINFTLHLSSKLIYNVLMYFFIFFIVIKFNVSVYA